jgi:hypothetical protein
MFNCPALPGIFRKNFTVNWFKDGMIFTQQQHRACLGWLGGGLLTITGSLPTHVEVEMDCGNIL